MIERRGGGVEALDDEVMRMGEKGKGRSRSSKEICPRDWGGKGKGRDFGCFFSAVSCHVMSCPVVPAVASG